jgi:hypothetical protein
MIVLKIIEEKNGSKTKQTKMPKRIINLVCDGYTKEKIK